MHGGWINPHREQQTIPQGQTSSPPKYFVTPTAKARPDQAALARSAEARGATHRARPRSPSQFFFRIREKRVTHTSTRQKQHHKRPHEDPPPSLNDDRKSKRNMAHTYTTKTQSQTGQRRTHTHTHTRQKHRTTNQRARVRSLAQRLMLRFV